jgi:membrane protein
MQGTPSESSRSELSDRPVGELVKQLSEQTSTLVRKELELARAEMIEKGKTAGIGAGMFAGAALLGVLALGALTAFLILSLSLVLDAWLAALIVALVYAAIAGVLVLAGKKKLTEATPPIPEQTRASVREDIEETKARVKAARS